MSLHKTTHILGLTLFWVWNVLSVFLCIFLIGIAVLPYATIAALNGEIPVSISICLLVLIITPLYSIYFGVKNSGKAVSFFFGVEIPIIILTVFRIFIVRELTFASGFLLLSAIIAIGIFALSLIRSGAKPKRLHPYITTAAYTLVLITGLYVAILSGLYAFPLIIEFIKSFVSFDWMPGFGVMDGLVLIILALFVFGSLAFFIFPIFIAGVYPKLWNEKGKQIAPAFSKEKYYLISLVFAAIWIGVFTAASQQGHAGYITALSQMSPAQQAQEMRNPDKVRQNLLHVYLNEYRYLGTKAQSRNLVPLYKKSIRSAAIGEYAQSIQSYLLSPLLYKGKTSDAAMAGKLYSRLFDSSIQRDEQKAITKALQATYNRDDVVAGLMNIGARNVLIREQNIFIEEKAGYAVVELEEIYENLTFENQEVFYYFSLPEDAALTGIWIGRTDKREDMDAFIVAPRGAAQKVYEQQVRRNIDPALLEQVGPGQYRLRVFPIPVTRPRAQFSRNRSANRNRAEQPLMRMHMRYVIPSDQNKQTLPVLLEKRNVDWSRKTKRSLNGNPVKVKSAWMPDYSAPGKTYAARINVAMGDKVMSLNTASQTATVPLGDLAVIVDTSYSMTAQLEKLNVVLSDLGELQSKNLANIDFYISSSGDNPMLKTHAYAPGNTSEFGSLTARMMINQFNAMADSAQYAAIVVLTDQGLYATNDNAQPVNLSAPLYFLHVDKAASAYDDDIMDLVYRTGGGVATSVSALQRQVTLNTSERRVSGDRIWTQVKANPVLRYDNSQNAKALAARQLILMGSFGRPPGVETLDKFHDLTKTHDVVTPYSSMIVLVNERQKQALKKESEANDRFEREGRSGEEALSAPVNPLVSGVPEPHEWLLIIMSLLMSVWVWRKRDDWQYSASGSCDRA